MDAGIVKSTLANGDQLIRPFINIVDVGMGGEVIELMEKKERAGSRQWISISTIQGLIQYENKNLRIEVNEQKIEEDEPGCSCQWTIFWQRYAHRSYSRFV